MSSTFNDYQVQAKTTFAVDGGLNTKVYYLTLGLVGEAGEVAEKIKKIGTDRYDPLRKGVHHHLDKEFGIEIHAVPMIYENEMICPHYSGERRKTGSAIGELLNDCDSGAVVDRGYALRIDLLMFYDLEQLIPAPLTWTDKGPTHTDNPISPQQSSAFRFKTPSDKRSALLGIILIER